MDIILTPVALADSAFVLVGNLCFKSVAIPEVNER